MARREELIEVLVDLGQDEAYLEDLDEEDLECLYEDITDTSSMHPNESYEDFMEHEDF